MSQGSGARKGNGRYRSSLETDGGARTRLAITESAPTVLAIGPRNEKWTTVFP
jgi:hypothetical protein